MNIIYLSLTFSLLHLWDIWATKFVHVFQQLSETISGYEAADKREQGKNSGTYQGQNTWAHSSINLNNKQQHKI